MFQTKYLDLHFGFCYTLFNYNMVQLPTVSRAYAERRTKNSATCVATAAINTERTGARTLFLPVAVAVSCCLANPVGNYNGCCGRVWLWREFKMAADIDVYLFALMEGDIDEEEYLLLKNLIMRVWSRVDFHMKNTTLSTAMH